MITDFSAQPKPQNKKARNLMILFFVLAAIAFAITTIVGQYRGIIGMLCVGFLTSGTLMYTKYLSVRFYYDIIATGVDEPLFVVRQMTGKREVTLCRVTLADIERVERETAAERKAHKKDKTTALFIYCPTLSPNVSYRMYVKSGFEKSELILEGSDEFFSKVVEFAAEARELRALNEEDDY